MEKILDTPAARHVPTLPPGMADNDPAWPNPAWAETVRRFSPRVELGPDCAPATATANHVTDDQVRLVLDVSRLLAVPTELDPLLSRIAELTTGLLGLVAAAGQREKSCGARREQRSAKTCKGRTQHEKPLRQGSLGLARRQRFAGLQYSTYRGRLKDEG